MIFCYAWKDVHTEDIEKNDTTIFSKIFCVYVETFIKKTSDLYVYFNQVLK